MSNKIKYFLSKYNGKEFYYFINVLDILPLFDIRT